MCDLQISRTKRNLTNFYQNPFWHHLARKLTFHTELREINQTIIPWKRPIEMPRKLVMILSRPRIGRKQISHIYFMSKDKLAICHFKCKTYIECREYRHFRTNFITSQKIQRYRSTIILNRTIPR